VGEDDYAVHVDDVVGDWSKRGLVHVLGAYTSVVVDCDGGRGNWRCVVVEVVAVFVVLCGVVGGPIHSEVDA
jgi:hypothetical protein